VVTNFTFNLENTMTTEQLNVSGMTCGGCVGNVTRALTAVPGVDKVDVSLPEHRATVKFDEGQTSVDAMRRAVRSAGYDIVETPVKSGGGGCCGS
jgi:copper chaperone